MGNRIIVKRIKGITQYYAKNHMSEFKKGDFLRLVPEFDNPYDHNALAIYDDHDHKLGFIDKYSNVEVYQMIKNTDYFCIITSVYSDYAMPSIEFQIIIKTNVNSFQISEEAFDKYLKLYNNGNSKHKKIESYTTKIIDIDSIIYDASDKIDDGEYDQAINLLFEYKEYNDSSIQFLLGLAYYKRNSNKNDLLNAKKYLKKAYELGNENAILDVGNACLDLEEYDEAFKCYLEAVNLKIVNSYNNIAICYTNGYGTKQNYRLAFLYFQMAAKEGISEAQFNLGNAYEVGNGTPINYEKAYEWYKKAADQNNPDALYNIGAMYYKGLYFNQDYDKALEYFNRVLDILPNDGMTYDYIGLVYFNKNNLNEALAYFKKGFELGYDISSLKVGVAYNMMGNIKEAKKWYLKAKNLGIEAADKYLEGLNDY